MTDYNFQAGHGYRFTLTNGTVNGNITAAPDGSVSVVSDANLDPNLSVWIAEIDGTQVSLYNLGLVTQVSPKNYLAPGPQYLDTHITAQGLETSVEFKGDGDLYTFILPNDTNPKVKEVTDSGETKVPRLEPLIDSSDLYQIHDLGIRE